MLSTVPCACKTNRHCRSSSEQRTSCEKWRTRYQYSRSPWVGEALPQTISNCLTLTELHINFYVSNFSFTLLHFRLLEMPLKNIGGEGLSPKKSKVDRSFVLFFCLFFFCFISCLVELWIALICWVPQDWEHTLDKIADLSRQRRFGEVQQ